MDMKSEQEMRLDILMMLRLRVVGQGPPGRFTTDPHEICLMDLHQRDNV